MISRRKFLILVTASAATMATAKAFVFGETEEETELKKLESELSKYKWGMVIDVDKCTECIKELMKKTGAKSVEEVVPPCIKACNIANNVPEFEEEKFKCYLMRIIEVRATKDAEPLYMPVMCQECEYPACVEVCPTKASYKRVDGIIVIDLHRCIGCRYCMVACPYDARKFLFKDPLEGLKQINPEAPIRKDGVVMKCEFCLWKIDRERALGLEPKPVCVEACPKGALIFGNLNDPNSEISKIIRTSKVIRLRASLGTNPKVRYKL